MFQFIYSEEWWLNVAILVAVIGGVVSIGCVITEAVLNRKEKFAKIGGMIQNTDTRIGGIIQNTDTRIGGMIQNTDTRVGGMIQNTDTKLSKDHERILHDLELTKNLASEIKTEILVEKEKGSLKYSSLSDVQKTIVDSVKNLDLMASQLETLAGENKLLHQEISTLNEKVNELEMENSRQKSEIIELKIKPLEKKRDRGMER